MLLLIVIYIIFGLQQTEASDGRERRCEKIYTNIFLKKYASGSLHDWLMSSDCQKDMNNLYHCSKDLNGNVYTAPIFQIYSLFQYKCGSKHMTAIDTCDPGHRGLGERNSDVIRQNRISKHETELFMCTLMLYWLEKADCLKKHAWGDYFILRHNTVGYIIEKCNPTNKFFDGFENSDFVNFDSNGHYFNFDMSPEVSTESSHKVFTAILGNRVSNSIANTFSSNPSTTFSSNPSSTHSSAPSSMPSSNPTRTYSSSLSSTPSSALSSISSSTPSQLSSSSHPTSKAFKLNVPEKTSIDINYKLQHMKETRLKVDNLARINHFGSDGKVDVRTVIYRDPQFLANMYDLQNEQNQPTILEPTRAASPEMMVFWGMMMTTMVIVLVVVAGIWIKPLLSNR